MKKNGINITENELIAYLDRALSIKDTALVENWIKASDENRKQYLDVKKIWTHSITTKDLTSINVAQDWEKVKGKMKFEHGPSKIKPLASQLQWFARIAAIFILFSGISYAIFAYLNLFAVDTSNLIVKSSQSTKMEIKLNDGTLVVLNKNSKLKYPQKFNGDIRKVYLSGEGYFEVSQDKEKPFVVETEYKTEVKVLGTSFNLKNDIAQKAVELNVLTGKVSFYQTGNEEQSIILHKKEQGIYKNNQIRKLDLTNPNFLSWRTGVLIFNNEDLANVVDQLGEHYGEVIILKSSTKKEITITSVFDNQTLVDVLEELKLMLNADYERKNNIIVFNLN